MKPDVEKCDYCGDAYIVTDSRKYCGKMCLDAHAKEKTRIKYRDFVNGLSFIEKQELAIMLTQENENV